MNAKRINPFVSRALDLGGLAALLLFSFFLSFQAGERGFFATDQAHHFDGAYRIFCGQIPYKDFFSAVGPMTFWLHALPFKIFGVNYFAYLFGAAFVNLLATGVTVAILRLFFPQKAFISFLGGFLTAIWFYPPFGTPVYEQTAMFFSLLAILLTTAALVPTSVRFAKSNLFLFLAGIMMTAAFLSKQSIFFFLPVFFLFIGAAGSDRKWLLLQRTFAFLSGLLGGMAVFLGWLLKYSDLRNFSYFFLTLPADVGAGRIRQHLETFISLKNVGPATLQQAMHVALIISAAGIFLYCFQTRAARESWRRPFLASLLCLYGIFFQYAFICYTWNQPEVACALAGLLFALGAGILLELVAAATIATGPTPSHGLRIKKTILMTASLVLVILPVTFGLAKTGIEVALSRSVHDGFNKNTRFPRFMSLEKLRDLKWGQPTFIRNEDSTNAGVRKENAEITEEDFMGVYEYLKAKDRNFFVFTDYRILYGLLNKPSPQPLLEFHKGLSYPSKYDPAIDQAIVDALEKNQVHIVVVEKVNFFGTKLADFPRLENYVRDHFSETKKIGIFSIYEKK
jgi:hypothetical protein